MKKITVLHNQSILDIAIQHTGSVENAFAIAVENNLSVTANLIIGSKILIPSFENGNNDIKNYYEAKKIQPSTNFINEDISTLKGIGHMIIGSTFKVG